MQKGVKTMFKQIEGLPENVLGIEVSGKLTHEDYVDGMLLLCDEMLEKHKPLKMMLVIARDFGGMELSAMWDDMSYGIRHWNDLSHIAFVTDEGWIRNMTALFKPFFPGEVKFYGLDEVEQAKDWIVGARELAA